MKSICNLAKKNISDKNFKKNVLRPGFKLTKNPSKKAKGFYHTRWNIGAGLNSLISFKHTD